MNLIYNEYINFLNEIVTNKEVLSQVDLKEGFYWLDRMIVKCYDIEGKIHKVFRLKVDERLNISIKTIYKNKPFIIESWKDTVNRNKERLEKLEQESFNIIKDKISKYSNRKIICTVSGGKDSSIVEYLLSQITKEYEVLFSNTTNETHHTYKYVKEKYPNLTIITPREGFYSLINRTGFIPTRFARQCCSSCKEEPMIQQLNKDEKLLFMMGMRREESNKRSTYEEEWKNIRWTNRDWMACLPILYWNEEDIYLYSLLKNVELNQVYKFGYARCGCTYCPFRSNMELAMNRYFLPKYEKRWQEVLTHDFIQNKKSPTLNCNLQEYIDGAWRAGMMHNIPSKETIQEFAEQQGLSYNIAKKYFNKTCSCCNKKMKKDEIAMYLKTFGRYENIKNDNRKYLCRDCLCKELNIDTKEYKSRVKEFKNQGCELF